MIQRIEKSCAFKGCNRPSKTRGYCIAHYHQWRRVKKLHAIGKRIRGPEHHLWRGGIRIHKDRDGQKRVELMRPNHPNAQKSGYILRSRLVMEKKLGRYLLPNEIVHHINKNTMDDRLENLQVYDRGEHTKYHFTIDQYNHGENSYRAKLSNTQVRNIRALSKRGYSSKQIIRKLKLNVVPHTIFDICIRRTWKHI